MNEKCAWRPCSIDIVIIKDEKVLMILRSHGVFKGCWVLPGGMVEHGERIEETCIREAKEETGLDVEIVGFVGVFDAPDRDPEKNSVSFAFLCNPSGDEVKINEEATEFKWFPLNRLPEKIGWDHRKVIEKAADILKEKNPKEKPFI